MRWRRSRKVPHVVLIHAGGLDGRMWRPLAERLDDRFRLDIPDLRGHGSTPLPPEPYTHAEDLVRMLDQLKVERAVVIGCSFGGWVALQLATLAPERVRALALMPGTLSDTEDWSPEIEAFWAQEDALVGAGDIDGAVALNVRTWVREPQVADVVAEMARTALEHQAGAQAQERVLPVDLPAIAHPTLAVSGGRDFPDFARMADRVAAEVPGGERAEVPDAGHLIALERPDAAAEILGPWLERVSA
jgi:3-oxoadipate enol-lactonase